MSYINTKSNRTFDFFAPFTEEGDRVQRIPFPIAVKRAVEGTNLVHDCNPQLVEFPSGTAAGTITVDTQVQPGSLLIVRNEDGTNAQTVGGATCAKHSVTTLLWDGAGYITIGSTSLAEEEGDE